MASPDDSRASEQEQFADTEVAYHVHWRQAQELLEHVEGVHNETLLDKAMQAAVKAADILSVGSWQRNQTCTQLGRLLCIRFERYGDLKSLDEAIELYRECMSRRPKGHEHRGSACATLAIALAQRYESTGDDLALAEANELFRETLSLCPEDSPSRPRLCTNLANSLEARYKSIGDVSLLREAIELFRTALSLFPKENPDRPLPCASLATALQEISNQTSDDGALNEAVECAREALNMCPIGHPNRALSCTALAIPLMASLRSTDDECVLLEVIGLFRESLALCPPGNLFYRHSCDNLATALMIRWSRTDDEQLISEAIDLRRQSLAQIPKEHPNRSRSREQLESMLRLQYQNIEDDGLLIEIADLQRESLTLIPGDHPDRAKYCARLASTLQPVYVRSKNIEVLAEVIALQRESLSLRPPGHQYRASYCMNLIKSLEQCYVDTDDRSLMTEIIDLYREARASYPVGHPALPRLSTDLAISLMMLYGSTGDEHLLTEAVDIQHESLALSSGLDRARACDSLAALFHSQYRIIKDPHLLAEALSLKRESLALVPKEHPLRAHHCSGLADALSKYLSAIDSYDFGAFREIADLCRESLALRPEGHPERSTACEELADALMVFHANPDQVDLLIEIHDLYKESARLASPNKMWKPYLKLSRVHLKFGHLYDTTKALQYLCESLEHPPDSLSDLSGMMIMVSKELDEIVWGLDGLEPAERANALSAYQQLVKFMPLLINPTIQSESQLRVLSNSNCYRIALDTFVISVLSKSWPAGLESLEMAQGLLWSQRLNYRDPQLDMVPPTLAAKLEGLMRAVDTKSGETRRAQTAPQARKSLHAQVIRCYALLREIRSLPGLDHFMLGESHKALCSVASTHPVVVLAGSRGYFYALVLKPDAQQHDVLELQLSDDDIYMLLEQTAGIPSRSHRGAPMPEDPDVDPVSDRAMKLTIPPAKGVSSDSLLRRRLKLLWTTTVKPILDHLGLHPSRDQPRPRLHWCLTGIFNMLPLHAAGIYDGDPSLRACCLDYVVSSYTPTLTALLRAQKGATPLMRHALSIALIAEKKGHDANLVVIHGVDKEVEDIESLARFSRVGKVHRISSPTTISRTCEAMQSANVVHLACHGIQDGLHATQSGFCLGDGRLTISQLMDSRMEEAFLAFLSACDTASGDKEHPDQAMHLAAAMLFTGFRTVVATMWAISDADGPRVAKWFYQELFAKDVIDVDTVAYALDVAVAKLRDSGVPLYRWAPFIHMGA